MAIRIHIKFEDFSAFESATRHYQKAENVQFYRRDSRTVAFSQSRLSNKTLEEKTKYYEITFHCINGERKYKSSATGARGSIYLSIYLFNRYKYYHCLFLCFFFHWKSTATWVRESICLSIYLSVCLSVRSSSVRTSFYFQSYSFFLLY